MKDVLKLNQHISDFFIVPLFMIQIIMSPLIIYLGNKSLITPSVSDHIFLKLGDSNASSFSMMSKSDP